MEQKQERRDKPAKPSAPEPPGQAPEVGGRDGPEPTRYSDWEVNGICTDF
ncbi:succinate dehydrogenase assembly factor 4 [Thermaurantiacus sp.]